MSKKRLNTANVLNELSGHSVFFRKDTEPADNLSGKRDEVAIDSPSDDIHQPANHETMTPRNDATMVSRYHATIIEVIRKAVKEFGKEAATHRFTTDEKRLIADLVYTYNRQGIRTSENEITRIAVNFILQDHQENGESCILNLVLQALHA